MVRSRDAATARAASQSSRHNRRAGREQRIDVIPGTLNAVVAPDTLSARVQLEPSKISSGVNVLDNVELYF